MGHSQRVTLNEVRIIMRLVREACELGDDAVAWRAHVLRVFGDLIGARWSIAYLGGLPFDPATARMPLTVTQDVEPVFMEYLDNRDLTPDPCTFKIIPRLGMGFSETREQLCDNQEWYRSQYYNEVCEPSHINHYAISIVPIPEQGFFHGITFVRGLRERTYTKRHTTMLGVLHEELALLWKQPSLTPQPECLADLSPRLRQVLNGFCAGLSEKQIARNLGLSKSTIHNHAFRLHRILNVNSRGELLAKARPRPSFRPRLLPTDS